MTDGLPNVKPHSKEWEDLDPEMQKKILDHNYMARTETEKNQIESRYDPMEKIANAFEYPSLQSMKETIEVNKREAFQAQAGRNGTANGASR